MTTPRSRDLAHRAARALGIALCAICAGVDAAAQTYEITWHTVDGGGATALSGATYVLGGTAGQPDAGGPLAGDSYGLSGGFWHGAAGPDIDLAVTITDVPDPVSGLNLLTYTFHIANAGPADATLVTLDVTLPPAAAFVTAGGSGWSCGEASGVVHCTRPVLAVGAAPDVVVEVTTPASAGTLTVTATIAATEADVDTSNNVAEAQTTVSPTPVADVSVVKSDGGVEAQWNEPLAYTITVANAGPAAATGASVADTFPDGLLGVTWSCVASGGASCAPNGAGDIADLVFLPAGTSVTYTATGIVAYGTPGPIANTATVGGVTDPDIGNNSSSVSTTVTDLIFRDGFESGDLSEWDSAQTDGGDLTVEAGAAMGGTLAGIQARVDDTAGLFVQDDSPTDENRYRARLYVDPTGFDPGESANHRRTRVLIGFEENPTRRLMAIVLRRLGGEYSVMARARRDDNSQADTGFFAITPGPHVLEVDWIRSSGPDASDGEFRFWVDGVLRSTLTGLDNSVSSVDFARMGALSVKVGATGTLRFDEFESRRLNYIGPLP